MIELKNLSVAYGNNVIYKDFSFRFDEGVNAVLGVSGSGKTTLLRAVCGLVEYGGEIECPPASVVFQNPCLAPVSSLSNVLAVLDGKDAKQIAQKFLDLCRVGDKAMQRATRLSGGEQQRVALARAFAANRPVLLLDEPFHSLDLGVKRKLYATLDELLRAYAKTVILVTHDVDEALLLADEIFLLSERPARLDRIVSLDVPRAERDGFSPHFAELRKTLQNAIISRTSDIDVINHK